MSKSKPDAWVARDESGTLWVFKTKTKRNNGCWFTNFGDWWWIEKPSASKHKNLTWEHDPIPVSIVPAEELDALREVAEAARESVVFATTGLKNRCVVTQIDIQQALKPTLAKLDKVRAKP